MNDIIAEPKDWALLYVTPAGRFTAQVFGSKQAAESARDALEKVRPGNGPGYRVLTRQQAREELQERFEGGVRR